MIQKPFRLYFMIRKAVYPALFFMVKNIMRLNQKKLSFLNALIKICTTDFII